MKIIIHDPPLYDNSYWGFLHWFIGRYNELGDGEEKWFGSEHAYITMIRRLGEDLHIHCDTRFKFKSR